MFIFLKIFINNREIGNIVDENNITNDILIKETGDKENEGK